MHNLNYHRAYGEFRNARKWLRDRSKRIDGDKLAGELLRYSERGAKYVKTLRTIMRANDLAPLDDAQLHKDRWTQDELSDTDQKS
jgi:Bax protein